MQRDFKMDSRTKRDLIFEKKLSIIRRFGRRVIKIYNVFEIIFLFIFQSGIYKEYFSSGNVLKDIKKELSEHV